MKRRTTSGVIAVALALALVAAGCGRSKSSSSTSTGGGGGGAPAAVPGFDGSTIKLGVLTPKTGPAAIIGNPLTAGNEVYFKMLNDKGGIDGKYKVELVERDNKYTPEDTITQYNQIKGDVAAFVQILGTQPLLSLQPQLDRDDGFAGPATLDAPWYKDEHLMPILAPYQIQAINSVSYYVNNMDGKGKKLCSLTSTDGYGQAGKEGFDFAVKQLNEKAASEQTFTVGQTDYTAQIGALQSAGCDMVWLTSLPTDAIPILKRAIQVNFAPQWIGQSPTWVSALPGLTDATYMSQHYLLASEGVQWGDTSVPGMNELLDAIKKYAPQQKPDIYFVFGWLQSEAMSQILATAVKNGDLSHKGIVKAAADTKKLTFNGMVADETFGAPDDRNPSRSTTLFKVTPDTADTNGGLTLLAPDAKNFSTDAAKAFNFQ
jgi:ABC-type branched-subunit amino acid transport system substrate-binding protein